MPKTIKHLLSTFVGMTLLLSGASQADEKNLPEVFQGYDRSSTYEINYDDYTYLLRASVLNAGRSSRAIAKSNKAKTGTRLRANINKLTALEGNRFLYESFKKDEHKKHFRNISESLQKVPSEVPLKLFSKDEQLAYWLNLYNATIIAEIIDEYPIRKLEDFLTDSDSPLNEKILTVAGEKLSLNDIKYKIVPEKFGYKPVLIYGFYQGIIAGPNILNRAFTGETVWDELDRNATNFVNSNRGTYADTKKKIFRVSSLYERDKAYFPNFDEDLNRHILQHLEGSLRYDLENAKRVRTNISNWKIADVYGTERQFGGAIANNNAALMDSASRAEQNIDRDSSGYGNINLTVTSSFMEQRAINFGRFSPEMVTKLKTIHAEHLSRSGQVSITDIASEEEEDKSDEGSN